MGNREGPVRMLATVGVALLTNLVLDLAFDLPVLVRWAIALTVVLLLTVSFELARRRVAGQALRGGAAGTKRPRDG